jgi:hypothetical protein
VRWSHNITHKRGNNAQGIADTIVDLVNWSFHSATTPTDLR